MKTKEKKFKPELVDKTESIRFDLYELDSLGIRMRKKIDKDGIAVALSPLSFNYRENAINYAKLKLEYWEVIEVTEIKSEKRIAEQLPR